MAKSLVVQFVTLATDYDVWCDTCLVSSVMRVTYVIQYGSATPNRLRSMSYCAGCKGYSHV